MWNLNSENHIILYNTHHILIDSSIIIFILIKTINHVYVTHNIFYTYSFYGFNIIKFNLKFGKKTQDVWV